MTSNLTANGNVKVDCDASIYSKMLFIFITERVNKYFLNDGPNVGLECLRQFNANIFTEWQPGPSCSKAG